MNQKLEELIKKSIDLLNSLPKDTTIHLISHIDADGIASAGIVCNALLKAKYQFQATLIRDLSPDFIKTLSEESKPLIFCDMGSSQLQELEKLDRKILILDHHKPLHESTSNNLVQVNAHLCGIDGTFEACSASLAYSFAIKLDKHNQWLVPLALAGAMGDKQFLNKGYNKEILAQAINNNLVTPKIGLKLKGKTVKEAIEKSIDPFFTNYSGKPESSLDLLDGLGINPAQPLEGLDRAEAEKLLSQLVIELIKQGVPDKEIKELRKEKFYTHFRDCKTISNLSFMLDACGYLDKPGLGLACLLGDKEALIEARALQNEYKQRIIKELLRIETEGARELDCLLWVEIEDKKVASPVTNLSVVYLFNKKPLLSLAAQAAKLKISARATSPMLEKGIDLAEALEQAASAVGGYGGGHPIAAGASIPLESKPQFLKAIDQIIRKQLKEGS
jgi:single-stranded DNA-specific DHH superfamily exonuclease